MKTAHHEISHRMKYLIVFLALLSGCATVQSPAPIEQPPVTVPAPAPGVPVPEARTDPTQPPAAPVRKENVAVASLMESAETDAKGGRLANAAASLERALRIEPRNPRLWHELARVRLQQGDYAQAESTAARANSWMQGDAALRAANWRLIAQAREARGDAAGARTARETAERQR